MSTVSIYSIHQLNLEAQRRVAGLPIGVSFELGAETAYTNGSDIVLPLMEPPVTEEYFNKVRGWVIHECAHNQPWNRGAFDIMRAEKPNERMAMMFNLTEDPRIETDAAKRNRGDAKALSILTRNSLDEAIEYFSGLMYSNPGKELEGDDVKRAAALALSFVSRDPWNTGTLRLNELVELEGPKVKALYTELLDEDWKERFIAMRTPQDAWDLAVALHDRLWPDEEEQDEEEQEQEGDGSEGETEDTDGEASVQDTKLEVNWSELEHSPDMGEANNTGGKVHITYDELKTKWVPDPEPKWSKGGAYVSPNFMPQHDDSSAALANQIRRYIQSQRRLSYTHNLEEGELDGSSLYKIAMPGYSDSKRAIFMEPKNTKGLNTAISIVCDCSGSMQGTPHEVTAQAAHRLLAVFEQSLRCAVEVLGFTSTSGGHVMMLEHKAFRERYSPESVAAAFTHAETVMYGNADADAILVAYDRLMRRPEPRKIMIVLSDGEPTDAYLYGDAAYGLHMVISEIRKAGKVQLEAIGIQDTSVKGFYGRDTMVVHQLKDLDGAILETLRKGFTK